MISKIEASVVLILMLEKCTMSQDKQKERLKKRLFSPAELLYTALRFRLQEERIFKKAGQRNVAS